MLMNGELDADKSKKFFCHQVVEKHLGALPNNVLWAQFDAEDFASTAKFDFQQLLIILRAVGAQEVGEAEQPMVRITIFKY